MIIPSLDKFVANTPHTVHCISTMAAQNNGDAKHQSFVSEMTDDPMIKKLALKDPGPQNIATISAGESRNKVIYSFKR
jgi:hypothetical protein